MSKHTCIALAGLLFFGCSGTSNDQEQKDTMPAQKNVSAMVEGIQVYKPNIEYTDWEGNLYSAMYWKDSLGENVFIISGTPQYFWKSLKPSMRGHLRPEQDPETFSEATEIFAYHYILRQGENKWELYSSMSDYRMGCCDVFMEYQDKSMSVVNIDNNGTAEVCFMYNATEADGMLTHDYLGTMVLAKDTSWYKSLGATGMANIDAEKSGDPAKKVQLNAPTGVYENYMAEKWKEFFAARIELDSAVTQ